MQEIYFKFQHYIETGGVTMYPLILCCFTMWLLILFNLPVWKRPLVIETEELKKQYSTVPKENVRHNRYVYDFLLSKSYRSSVKGLSTVKLLATLAPLLGLFGTVTGMINTFESVSIYGLGNPKALAAGISEAMITTQFGLLVALPGILFVFFLQRRAYRDHTKIKQLTGTLVPRRS